MTIALMWEARAVPGQGPELLDWARTQRLDPAPLRRQNLTAPGDRVLVITWWAENPGGSDTSPEPVDFPEPDATLLSRPVHRWRFTVVDDD